MGFAANPGVVRQSLRRMVPMVAAMLLIVAVDFPWDLQDHPHWARVGWIPFFSPPVRLLDIGANLLLGAPVGLAAVAYGLAPGIAGILAFVAAFVGESVQLFSHWRYPSTTDVVCNALGAVLAARVAASRLARRPAAPLR
jgi:hypothetical protein